MGGNSKNLKSQSSADNYRALFDNLRSGVAVYETIDNGRNFVFKDFNKAAEVLEKKKKSQVVGKNLVVVFPGAVEMGVLDTLRKVHKTGKPQYFPEAAYRDNRGNILFWRENYIYKLPSGEIVAVYNDITDRKKAEERYRALYEKSRDSIMTLSPPDWRFTSANPATLKMFNVGSEKEFISLGPEGFSPEKQYNGKPSMPEARKMINIAMKKGSHFFEWLHQRAGGETFDASVLLNKIEIEGKGILQATVRDISEQKKAEGELENKVAELQQLNKLMIGRELKMVELKEKIKRLESKK